MELPSKERNWPCSDRHAWCFVGSSHWKPSAGHFARHFLQTVTVSPSRTALEFARTACNSQRARFRRQLLQQQVRSSGADHHDAGMHQKLLSSVTHAMVQTMNYQCRGTAACFITWCATDNSAQRDAFVQYFGIKQMVFLVCHIFEGILSAEEWMSALPNATRLLAFLGFESYSDDLSNGLARCGINDSSMQIRRKVVHAFNAAAVNRLQQSHSAHEYVSLKENLIRQMPMLGIGIYPEKLLRLGKRFVEETRWQSLDELNTGLKGMLVANIESCNTVFNMMEDLPCAQLVRKGLINRYKAADALIFEKGLSLQARIDLSVESILVTPVIAVLMSAIGRNCLTADGLNELEEDGTIEKALVDASAIVRLLNDLGDLLSKLESIDVQKLRARMEEFWKQDKNIDFGFEETLLKFSQDRVEMTRIRKDLVCGEHNLALETLPKNAGIDETLNAFFDNLAYMRSLYKWHDERLNEMTKRMNERLGDNRFSAVILRFVEFHKVIYGNEFESKDGEYGI